VLVADAVAAATQIRERIVEPAEALQLAPFVMALRAAAASSSFEEVQWRYEQLHRQAVRAREAIGAISTDADMTLRPVTPDSQWGRFGGIPIPDSRELRIVLNYVARHGRWAARGLGGLTSERPPELEEQGITAELREAANGLEALEAAVSALRVFTDAWLAFAPHLQPRTRYGRAPTGLSTHTVTLRYPGGPVTVSEAHAWLGYLDALVSLAIADTVGGETDARPAAVLLERIEFGSFSAWLNLPEVVMKRLEALLTEMVHFTGRGLDTEGHRVRVDGERVRVEGEQARVTGDKRERELDGVLKLMSVVEKVNASVAEGRMSEEEGTRIKLFAEAAHRQIDLGTEPIEISVDNRILATVRPAGKREEPKRLMAPAPEALTVDGPGEDDDGRGEAQDA
jgi:hypothetical protein